MKRSVLAVSIVVAGVVCGGLRSSAEAQQGTTDAPRVRLKAVAVPVVKPAGVVIDGMFSPGEWDGASRQRLSENIEMYLLADSENLYVGFKLLKDVEADLVSEVYLATSDKEFLNLHSSGALGEGVNAFSPDLRVAAFSIGQNNGWESNATGRGVRSQGKEYKISRALLPNDSVRMAGGMIVVNKTMTERGTFPDEPNPLFADPDTWRPLVLLSEK
jgi:hypothetical protein